MQINIQIPKPKFNDAQLSQIHMAEENGVDSIIKEHPEWSYILMNYCWNREKEGKDISSILRAGEYFAKNNIPEYSENSDVIMRVVDILDAGQTPVSPGMIIRKKNLLP